MPLKHTTETFFVFLLGVVIALTGILLATLPSLPDGVLPAGLLGLITIVYPLILSPMFRKNRADHLFRMLHWFPFMMVLIWFVIEMAAQYVSLARTVSDAYVWGWTLPLVALGFLSIFFFCLHVIRRRVPRIFLLLATFIPFVALAMVSESGANWDQELASILWDHEMWVMLNERMSGTGSRVEVAKLDEEKNLEVSEDPAEEAWRERLRAFERRRERIAARLMGDEGEEAVDDTEVSEVPEEEDIYTGTGEELREVATLPSSLPTSGAGVGFLGFTMIMGYCGLLHQRARRRS